MTNAYIAARCGALIGHCSECVSDWYNFTHRLAVCVVPKTIYVRAETWFGWW